MNYGESLWDNTFRNLHLFAPLALNDIRIKVIKDTNSGLTTAIKDILISSSSLLANNT